MNTPYLILSEIRHRKLNVLLSLLGMVAAVTLFVFFFTAGEASRRETTRIMRDLGLNLRIIPAQTAMDKFWATGFSEATMPEDCVHRLAAHTGLNYSHLLPLLRRQVAWRDREVILVGILPEIAPVDQRQPSMSFKIDPGSIYLGHELARDLGLKTGDAVDLLGREFTVAKCLPENGSHQDISVFGHLHDVQGLVGMPGRINEIQALNCLCFDTKRDALDVLREQLASVLPEAKVIQIRSIAEARENQRRMIEDYLAVILPCALVVCAAWIGLLAMVNVRERRQEIGVLRALGRGSGRIAALFLGKAVVVGILGAAIGFGLGTGLALIYGPGVFHVTGQTIKPMYGLLGWSAVIAPAFAALSAFLPTMVAVAQDPAVILREE